MVDSHIVNMVCTARIESISQEQGQIATGIGVQTHGCANC